MRYREPDTAPFDEEIIIYVARHDKYHVGYRDRDGRFYMAAPKSNGGFTCQYRGPDGCKCAIGHAERVKQAVKHAKEVQAELVRRPPTFETKTAGVGHRVIVVRVPEEPVNWHIPEVTGWTNLPIYDEPEE